MAKKYYWLKLKEDFFRLKEIKKLRKIAGGDTYTIIYLKLQLLSIKNEGRIVFDQVEDDFADELALELDEDPENVRMTLLFLQKHNLLEFTEFEGEYLLPAVLACIGRESESAERMRRLRARQKQQQLPGGTNEETIKCDVASQCDVDVRKSDTDIDIDIEIEQQQEQEQDVVAVFAKSGINIQAVMKKHPTVFSAQRDVDWEIVASTLAAKKAAGKIANPVGLLMADPAGIIDDILGGRFYPDLPPPKKKKSFGSEPEIYVSPATIERLQVETT